MPVIVVNKSPLFPKFVKILEVHDERLMKVLRRKVELNQPYAGVFVKKDDDNEKEVVDGPDQVHPVGTFAQIVEFQDLGTRLRMVLMAHRRIRLVRGLPEEEVTPATKDVEVEIAPVPAASQPSPAAAAAPFLLMGETENVPKETFESSDELKAIIQEVIKTIRDIIVRA